MGDPLVIAKAVFAEIRSKFPKLRVIERTDDPVEFNLVLAQQDGLKFEVTLGLHNRDELHFGVGHFQLGWFPCTEPARVADYVAAVAGFLSGEWRVMERHRGKRCVAAELQAPDGPNWRTVGKWSRLSLPWPLKVTRRELRNM